MNYTYPVPPTPADVRRILLSEGSGLTSRQVASRLGQLGHHVEVATSDPLCLARFTRHTRGVHRVPRFGDDPVGWLDATLAVAAGRFDVLFPTQEQVAVLSRHADRVAAAGLATAVPPWAALIRVQDKVTAQRTLAALGVPQPRSEVVPASGAGPAPALPLPAYVKAAVGTGSRSVRRVTSAAELAEAVASLAQVVPGDGRGGPVALVQEVVDGPLAMVQAVFDGGRLVAFHAAVRRLEGASGGAALKESVHLPAVREQAAHLGRSLGWHGALSADVLLGPDGPVWIDVNPRLVEPGNALAAGLDLTAVMLELIDCRTPQPRPEGHHGVLTRQSLIAVLGAAQHRGTRRAVAATAWQAARARGPFAASTEELTPAAGDPLALVAPALVAAATLVRPAWWRAFSSGAVGAYALTATGWQQLRGAGEPAGLTTAGA